MGSEPGTRGGDARSNTDWKTKTAAKEINQATKGGRGDKHHTEGEKESTVMEVNQAPEGGDVKYRTKWETTMTVKKVKPCARAGMPGTIQKGAHQGGNESTPVTRGGVGTIHNGNTKGKVTRH